MSFRSGFVSILGLPNAGKSTLLNSLIGEKVAIVTHKAQTTRNRIQGFRNVAAKKGRPQAQIVFIDTPGIHKPDSQLGRKMMSEVHDALAGCDLLLMVVDASRRFGPADEFVLRFAKERTQAFLLLNKIDLIEKERLLPVMAHYSSLHPFQDIIPVSASRGSGLDLLVDKIVSIMPEGPRYFPKELITDQPERFIVAEIIREKAMQHAAQEVPYGTAVLIEAFDEERRREGNSGMVRIAAAIYTEREGQKAILIGKGGTMLKKIGTAARFEIEKLLGAKVFLELFVKVEPGWKEKRSFIDTLDWRSQLQDLGEEKTRRR